MTSAKIAILGAGSLRCSPPVLSCLSQLESQPELDVFLWDADEERLDLFDRIGRLCFTVTKSKHRLLASSDLDEALADASIVLVQLGAHCARKFVGDMEMHPDEAVAEALARIAPGIPDGCVVGSLLPPRRYVPLALSHRLDWPPALETSARPELLFQILRWLNEEDSIYPLLKAHKDAPLRDWLAPLLV